MCHGGLMGVGIKTEYMRTCNKMHSRYWYCNNKCNCTLILNLQGREGGGGARRAGFLSLHLSVSQQNNPESIDAITIFDDFFLSLT